MPKQFYTQQLEKYQEELSLVKKKLNISSALRLAVFLAIVFMVYLFWGNFKWMLPFAVLVITLFLFLVTRHSKLRYRKNLIQAFLDYNHRELRVLERDFHDLPDGASYNDPAHAYCQDIDLFGRGSFFQYVNRTALKSGTDKLVAQFLANDPKDISEKQEVIKELSALAVWRQQFYAIATLVKTEVAASEVSSWLQKYASFTPSFSKAMAFGFSGLSLLSFIAYYFNFISGYVVIAIFGVGLLISSRYFKKIGELAHMASKIQSTFDQYAKLVSTIETQEMTSSILSARQRFVVSGDTQTQKDNAAVNKEDTTSEKLKSFSKLLDALDQRNNILVAIFINGFFLRDILISYKIEKWIDAHKNKVPNWFETIAFFDAYNSLGNYAFNHPSYCYPEVLTQGDTLKSKKAIHPLLNPEIAVPSDIEIGNEQFFIVTGANMAGKSTFLRTVALQIVMGNMGLPLAAQKASYQPIKLITSMRTTDNLIDDESYFFSELKRLKFIVDEIKNDRYFIILDEILKGTNSIDKAIGSRKFVDKLVASNSTGIIATHDLSLTEAAKELVPVENYFFDARIINDELFFDYTLKKGVCENMNASFLLKKMEIVD